MVKRYTTEIGKFGAYFRDNEFNRDMSLEDVSKLLNELDDFKKYVKFVEVNKFK